MPKLTPKEVETMVKKGGYYILDVRPLDFERDRSFIPGARLCPLVYLEERYGDIPKESPILITDWAMKQSPSAAKFLLNKGYSVVGVLQGGMERWKSENLPFEDREPKGDIDPLKGEKRP